MSYLERDHIFVMVKILLDSTEKNVLSDQDRPD